MDLDIWDPPYDPVAEDNSLCTPLEWHFKFYYDCRFDVIEEDVLNEKCCIQVLRILITKADTEIDELEQDLILLQSELAWIENEEWSEIGSNALIEKINCLDILIKSLINKDKDDVEVHSLMHTQPVERLNEILEILLSNYFCKKDIQPNEVKDAFVLKSTSNAPREANNIMDRNKKLGNFSSKIIVKEEVQESDSTTEHAVISIPSLKNHEKKTGNIKVVKPADAVANDSSSHSLKLTAGFSDLDIRSNNSCPKSTQKRKARKHGLNPKEQRVVQNPSSSCPDKGKRSEEEIKLQHADLHKNIAFEELSCATGLREKIGNANSFSNSDDHQKLVDFTLNVESTKECEVPAPKKVVSSDSSVKAEEQETDLLQIVKVVEAAPALTETENCALTSLLEQQDINGKKAIKLQPKDEEKTTPEKEMTEIGADKKKFNLNMSQNSLKDIELNPQNILPKAGISSVVTKVKKREKSLVSPPIGSLIQRLTMIKEECESEQNGASPDTITSVKKTKKSLNSPSTFPHQMEFSTDCLNKDNMSVKVSLICDSSSEGAASVPYPELEKKKLVDLQRMAKEFGLTKYSKLTKKGLVQLLGGTLEKKQSAASIVHTKMEQ